MINILLVLQIISFVLIIWLFFRTKSKDYEIWTNIVLKQPNNNDKEIEKGDVLIGFLQNDFVEAEYYGGNPSLQTSYKIFKIRK